MADSYPPFTTRPSTKANTINRNDSCNNYTRRFLGKFMFFTFFLIAITLFPSQAPKFINQTVLNQFWELLHLLFIGIAVSYGLFGRRNVDDVTHDDSQSNAPAISNFSSVFEDGFYDYSMYCSGQGKAGIFNVKNGSFENPHEENVVQAWSSKYVQGEPMVVLAEPHCELSSFIDHNPLGLPVRSLKSWVESGVSSEFGNGVSESSGKSVMDSSDNSDKIESLGFSHLGSENFEGKYEESDLRSLRTRQRVGGGAILPTHFRPLSVDETQFRSLKSQSLHSQLSSYSPSSLSASHSSSSESPNSKTTESLNEGSSHQSFPHRSVNASHSRHYSDGSLLGTRTRKCFEDELKGFCDSKKDDSPSSSGTKGWISSYPLKFDAKPVAPSKASLRGKSVRMFRTFRGSGSARGPRENHPNKLSSKGESEPKFGHYNLSVGFKRLNLGGNSDIQNSTFSKNHNREQREWSESEDEGFRVSSGEETISGSLSVAGNDSYEVDRKAGEFIAKFRQQIKLQRTASIDSLKGLNTSGNFFKLALN
ncbi:Phosphotyrosine protein phosphatases superfamily protein [Hibiscus syriacus]|uniref:Phosphotyrosine protein phosphatases superfamily protein n=1 Tax=Hibiscus syriacus TaxID=106335 RepID=A0A6A2WVE4_HIBSY|nr:uncharacterized protein LOC120181611 [Hibiscus syriacus]KAE8665623.1 Phosphotyrosine protein phosphatases superfamily protein [Hibiscus syriacus]